MTDRADMSSGGDALDTFSDEEEEEEEEGGAVVEDNEENEESGPRQNGNTSGTNRTPSGSRPIVHKRLRRVPGSDLAKG